MKNTKSESIFSDALSIFKIPDAPLYAAPKSIQKTIEIKKVFPDGIFELNGNKWFKCYLFEDVNYATCDEADQESVFMQDIQWKNLVSCFMLIRLQCPIISTVGQIR